MANQRKDTDPVPVTETPEFVEAVANAKAELHAEFSKVIDAVKRAAGEPAVEGDTMSMFRQMAQSFAEIVDQDQNRPKRIPAEELAKRAHARSQMSAAIASARRKAEDYKATTGEKDNPGPDAPLYLAIGKSHLSESLIEPFEIDLATKKPYPVTFYWLDVPNEAMKPINAAAKEIYDFFVTSIGGKTEIVSPQAQSWIGSGGLVMAGMAGVPVSMQKHRMPENIEAFATDLYQRGPGEFDPRRNSINILGTNAEPARHVAAGGPEPRKGI
jgi:hypothetical protein